jgi:hypothetical protein
MLINLIDLDSKYPNFALKKVEKYHKDRGDEVLWNTPIMLPASDKTYISCVFTKNKEQIRQYARGREVYIGGTGYDLTVKLPPEIEAIKPRINYGFTTRGCIRKCSFCVVPHKEGDIHIVGDLLDLWDGKSKKIVLFDNNILSLPEHFKMICQQAIDNKITLIHNQGLDCRLLTPDLARWLAKTKHTEYIFAFDNIKWEPIVSKAIGILNEVGLKRNTWYVLVGYDSSFEEDLWRCNYLKEHNQNAYVMRHEKCGGEQKYTRLARWANQHHIFQKMTFKEFQNREYGNAL